MLNTYNTATQALATNANVVFDVNKIGGNGCCCGIVHAAGSPSIQLNRPGRYYVSFTGTINAATAPTAAITAALFNNNVAEPGAQASTLPAANAPTTLHFSTAVEVPCSCRCINNNVTLQVRNIGVATTFTNVNLVVYRLGD